MLDLPNVAEENPAYRLILAKTGDGLSYQTFWKGRYESERFTDHEGQCQVVQQVTIRSDLLPYHGAILSDPQQRMMMSAFIDWNRAIIKPLSAKSPGPYHFDKRLGHLDRYLTYRVITR